MMAMSKMLFVLIFVQITFLTLPKCQLRLRMRVIIKWEWAWDLGKIMCFVFVEWFYFEICILK